MKEIVMYNVVFECTRCGRVYSPHSCGDNLELAQAIFKQRSQRAIRNCDDCGDIGTNVVIRDTFRHEEIERGPANVRFGQDGSRLDMTNDL